MKLSYSLSFVAFALASGPTFAEQEWLDVASHQDGSIWSVKAGSLEFSETKGKIPIALVVGRITNSKTSQIDLYKWYVSGSDCASEMGKIVSLSIGGEYQYENDFVFGAGNIASAIAESICGAAKYTIKASQDKGL